MSTAKLDPRGLGKHHVDKLRSLYGQRGPIKETDSLVAIQRKAGQDDVIDYIENHFLGVGTNVGNY